MLRVLCCYPLNLQIVSGKFELRSPGNIVKIAIFYDNVIAIRCIFQNMKNYTGLILLSLSSCPNSSLVHKVLGEKESFNSSQIFLPKNAMLWPRPPLAPRILSGYLSTSSRSTCSAGCLNNSPAALRQLCLP